jgi:hypothetical protein
MKNLEQIAQAVTPSAQSLEARGLELMAQRDDLVFHGAHAYGPEAKVVAIATLDAWDLARSEEDWEAIRVATYGIGKVRRLRLVQVLEDVSPIGQRR